MAIETTIWIYWIFCLMAMIMVITNRKFAYSLLAPNSDSSASEISHQQKGYKTSLILGWLTTLLAAAGYILFTRKYETGPYGILDLLTFTFSNGVLEQFMFIFWFLLGCYIGKMAAPDKPILIFISGYLVYAVFSGLIHGLFWVNVLPAHQPVALMALALATMSLVWMWLAWRYRAIVAIIAMHIAIDFLTASHLHFTWFEPFQLIS